jgi:hemolysin III
MKIALTEIKEHRFKDPGSAITHLIGMILAMIASVPMMIKARISGSSHITMAALVIFAISMILLYGASTTYHSLDISPRINRILRKIDHMMIYVLIAGTYTPICLVILGDASGWKLLSVVWGIAAAGILMNALWITCPKWLSSALYIAMGWICVFAMSKIVKSLPQIGFMWLFVGGIIYTVGGIIYALKLPIFNNRHKNFGSHEIFHLFVMAGSFCHYMLMYSCVA